MRACPRHCGVFSSYGSVYKALDKRDGKLVAIKVLEVENEDTVELQKEINILKECDCEWIVRYKGSYRKDGNIWIVRIGLAPSPLCRTGWPILLLSCIVFDIALRCVALRRSPPPSTFVNIVAVCSPIGCVSVLVCVSLAGDGVLRCRFSV